MFMDRFGWQWQGPFRLDQSAIWTHAPRRGGVYQLLFANGDTSRPLHLAAAINLPIQQQLLAVAQRVSSLQGGAAAKREPLAFAFIECDDVAAQRIVNAGHRWSGSDTRRLDSLFATAPESVPRHAG
jgi:hypothetical protein